MIGIGRTAGQPLTLMMFTVWNVLLTLKLWGEASRIPWKYALSFLGFGIIGMLFNWFTQENAKDKTQ